MRHPLLHVLFWMFPVLLTLPSEGQGPPRGPDGPRRGAAAPLAEGAPTGDIGAEHATHVEAASLVVPFRRLSTLALAPSGELLAGDADARQIKVIDANGAVVRTLDLDFGPEAIDAAEDGTIYCGGEGKLARIDMQGKRLAAGTMPPEAGSELEPRRRSWSKPNLVSGIAVMGGDVFVAFGSGWSVGSKSKLFRYDATLRNPKLLLEGLRGCCQRCDITARDGVLYLAENAAHRVVQLDREGKVLGRWGERSRVEEAGFGSCCNPMNLCFDQSGVLYTSESGLGRVKRYSTSGEYLGLVGYVGVERFSQAGMQAASCSNIAIAATPDGSRVYVMDLKSNLIRVLEKRGAKG